MNQHTPSPLKVKLLREGARLPTRATSGSAGYDLYACIPAPLTIPAGAAARVPTGIAIAIPEGCVGLVFVRSGLGIKRGLSPSNAVGVIDWDYRGELLTGLRNHSGQAYTLQPGERFAQLVVLPVLTPAVEEWAELDETDRGAGGFGSTGV